MFIRDYLLIDTEDGEDILDLQSEKGGAQRTGVENALPECVLAIAIYVELNL